MKHSLLHIFGCLIPISLLFLLPALGVDSGLMWTLFFLLMFACHFSMMGGHAHHESRQDTLGDHDTADDNKRGQS